MQESWLRNKCIFQQLTLIHYRTSARNDLKEILRSFFIEEPNLHYYQVFLLLLLFNSLGISWHCRVPVFDRRTSVVRSDAQTHLLSLFIVFLFRSSSYLVITLLPIHSILYSCSTTSIPSLLTKIKSLLTIYLNSMYFYYQNDFPSFFHTKIVWTSNLLLILLQYVVFDLLAPLSIDLSMISSIRGLYLDSLTSCWSLILFLFFIWSPLYLFSSSFHF